MTPRWKTLIIRFVHAQEFGNGDFNSCALPMYIFVNVCKRYVCLLGFPVQFLGTLCMCIRDGVLNRAREEGTLNTCPILYVWMNLADSQPVFVYVSTRFTIYLRMHARVRTGRRIKDKGE